MKGKEKKNDETQRRLRLLAGPIIYPSFRRAPEGGKEIAEVIWTFPNYKGVDTEVRFADGTRGVCCQAYIEEKEEQ